MPRFFRRTVLKFVEGGAELFFFFQKLGELDAQFSGFGFYFGEAEGEFPFAGCGFRVAAFGAVAFADVLEAFCGVAAHAFAVRLELFPSHILPDAPHARVGEQIRDYLRRCLLEKLVGHGIAPSTPSDCIRWRGWRLSLSGPRNIPEDDAATRAGTPETREVHAELPRPPRGRSRRLWFSGTFRHFLRRGVRGIIRLVYDPGVRRLAKELRAVLQRSQHLAEDG